MALSKEQIGRLMEIAADRGIDPNKLISAAERQEAARPKASDPISSSEQPKLFQYLLPFVTVGEVRRVWLKLEEPFDGEDEVAASFAAKHSSSPVSSPVDE